MNFPIYCMNDVYALDGKLIRKQTNSLNGLKGLRTCDLREYAATICLQIWET